MKIICLGDSLTKGSGIQPDECWVSLLNRETKAEWMNAGIGGDTTVGMLVRLQTQVLPQMPAAVLLLGGTNDLLMTGSADGSKAAVMAMLHQCAYAGVRPVLGIPFQIRGVPPAWHAVCPPEVMDASAEYIRWLRALVKTLSLRCVDFDAAFAAAGDPQLLFLADGLHPSVEGNRRMADAVIQSGLFDI